MSASAVATGLPRRLSRAAERFGARGSRASLGALTYRPSAGHPDPLSSVARLTTWMAIFSLFVPNRKLAGRSRRRRIYLPTRASGNSGPSCSRRAVGTGRDSAGAGMPIIIHKLEKPRYLVLSGYARYSDG